MFKFKMPQLNHQAKILPIVKDKQMYAYLWDMGAGKTKAVLDDLAQLAWGAKIGAAVIIAPKGVYRNWPQIEIPKHWTEDIPIAVHTWDSNARGVYAEKALKDFIEPSKSFKFLIVNIEALSASKRAIDYVNKFVKANMCAVVVDESTTIKHRDSKRTKNVMALKPHAKYRRLMTGTPITNSPLDLYSQFAFLGTGVLGFTSFYSFRNFVAEMEVINLGVRTFQKVKEYKKDALAEITSKIQPYSSRITKEECLDLPPKIYQVREIEMSEQQRVAYEQMRKQLMVEFQNEYGESIPAVMVTTALTKIMKLHQITCGFVMDNIGAPLEIPGPNNRLDELMSVLDETDKCIIWANYRHNIRQIYDTLAKEFGPSTVAHYYGETKDDERREAMQNFQHGDLRFFIGNPQTAGFGLTLTAASNVVYYSNNYNIEHRQQSEDRAHRIGQTRSVCYTDLIVKGTIDEKIMGVLKDRKSLQDIVLKHGWQSLLQ